MHLICWQAETVVDQTAAVDGANGGVGIKHIRGNLLENRITEGALEKATCAAPLCEVLTPCRGQRPHHVQRDRIGTWEVSGLAIGVEWVPSTMVRIGKVRNRSR